MRSPSGPGHVFMTADAVGGVWTYALDLARALAPHGLQTTLAVLGPPPSDLQAAEARQIRGLDLLATGLPLDWTAAGEAEAERQLATLKAEVDRYQKRRDSIVAQLGALRDVISGFGDDDPKPEQSA